MLTIGAVFVFFLSTKLLASGQYVERSFSLCPNQCSGHGLCLSEGKSTVCSCFDGYHGGSCERRLCPAGVAWFDRPSADDVAHRAYSECSNMGSCDYNTGICSCRYGFGGAACEQLLCPMGVTASGNTSVCTGNGRCMSLRDSAAYTDDLLALDAVAYDDWDGDMVHGCVCDDGWEGSSCSRRSCPKGDDPYTQGQDQEIQVLECTCDGACVGSFRLSFQGEKTAKIPLTASAEVLKYRLEVRVLCLVMFLFFLPNTCTCTCMWPQQLDGVDTVSVSINLGESKICSNGGVATEVCLLRICLIFIFVF
jgi:hypothetical protein